MAVPRALNGNVNARSIKPVPRDFFDRDPRKVGRELLGKLLLREDMIGRIVETEAYLGSGDAAAHAVAGKTARNSVLWGPPGHAYVYFIYGNYFCLNVSCLPDGIAGCVLFRALEPLAGLQHMARNRGAALPLAPMSLRALTSGPGRLCEALGITRPQDNGADMTSRASGLWIGDDGFVPRKIVTTARIGITKSADAPLRYLIAGNQFVSGPKLMRVGRLREAGDPQPKSRA
jgi:DNA-3-methyladenine glycosylase